MSRRELPENPRKGFLHLIVWPCLNGANIWLWLSLRPPMKTPILRLPSACLESWAGPEGRSTFKPAGMCLTGELNFFLTAVVEETKVIPESHDSERAIVSFSTQSRGQANSSYVGLELQAGSCISSRLFLSLRRSPCPGYALLHFQTFLASSSIFETASTEIMVLLHCTHLDDSWLWLYLIRSS